MVLAGFRVFLASMPLDPIGIAKVTLPKIELVAEGVSTSGTLGEVEEIAIGQTKAYKVEVEFENLESNEFDLMNPYGVDLIFRGSVQSRFGSRAIKVYIKGKSTSLDLGSFENGKKMGSKLEFTTPYLHIEINGKEVFEHDKENLVYKINGIDWLAKLKLDLAL